MNICMCGQQDGFGHALDCPRPLYRGTEAQQEAWGRDRDANRAYRLEMAGDAFLSAHDLAWITARRKANPVS